MSSMKLVSPLTDFYRRKKELQQEIKILEDKLRAESSKRDEFKNALIALQQEGRRLEEEKSRLMRDMKKPEFLRRKVTLKTRPD